MLDKGLTNGAGLDEVSADSDLRQSPHSDVYRKTWGKTGRCIEHVISIEMVISLMHLTRLPALTLYRRAAPHASAATANVRGRTAVTGKCGGRPGGV